LGEFLAESETRRTHKHLDLRFLKLKFVDCPVLTTLGVLGKKWSLLILSDIAAYKVDRFNRLLESLPGIPSKVLATRLKELQQEGFIWPVENRRSHPMIVRWALTENGMDAFTIIMMIAAYGSKWNADRVFDDKKPRKLCKLFNQDAMKLIESFL
jgi:DNA-binding HxlR family transcriptional regulator